MGEPPPLTCLQGPHELSRKQRRARRGLGQHGKGPGSLRLLTFRAEQKFSQRPEAVGRVLQSWRRAYGRGLLPGRPTNTQDSAVRVWRVPLWEAAGEGGARCPVMARQGGGRGVSCERAAEWSSWLGGHGEGACPQAALWRLSPMRVPWALLPLGRRGE